LGRRGRWFDSGAEFSSRMLLLGEAWGLFPSEGAEVADASWFTTGEMGVNGLPGERFGADDGVPGSSFPGPWRRWAPEMDGGAPASLKTYVPWYRHPGRTDDRLALEGAANFGFLDGHVGLVNRNKVVSDATKKSTCEVLWSPIDERVERD